MKTLSKIRKYFAVCAVALVAAAGFGLASPTKTEAATVVYEYGYNYDSATVYDNYGYVVYDEITIYY